MGRGLGILVFSVVFHANAAEWGGYTGSGGNRFNPGPYGAVAYSVSSPGFGWSAGFRTRGEAELAAMANCGGWDCRVVDSYANGCMVLTVSTADRRYYATGYSPYLSQAKVIALDECNARAVGCTYQTWSCSP